MANRFRVSITLPRKLEELGLSPDTVLRQAALPMGLFKQDKVLVSTEEFFALYRGIAESSNDPGFGLKLGTEERVERYDPIKIAALSARSFRDAVERLSRYKQLTCPEEIRVVKRGNESAVQFIWLRAHEEEPPLLVDVCFAWIVGIGHRGTGRPLNPKRVELQRALAHREMYEAHFRCPVKFKSNRNALIFSKGDMELPFVTYNPDLLATVAPQLEAELAQQLLQKTFAEQAKGILKQLLAGQRPGIQDLARELHLSTRTLQRKLTEQGITFQHLLEEARRELARHYLLHSSRELNETAYLLGYEDANSFFRAFHHWEGTSPGRWRVFHRKSQTTAQKQLGAA
ncbi:MAG TPA: AraC family transcriptional regulator [Terriglobales bacterium]|jgi:AraC-like DNA-binding protein|nr:AraC family transcriptional regulator [Terriglobales bacterium]